ncbi:DUF4251 domain-containing protein [Mucilaginibacter sp. UYCu711]|uniref:DUF4251 domain-containing protein n=1 Tax=Mucilaginibacter sp. UYCu711 TaxID=3156339 RepID=UPI003D1D265D
MKKLSKPLSSLLFSLFVVTVSFAQTTTAEKKTAKAAEIKRLITSQNFVFKPEYAETVTPAKKLYGSYDLEVSKEEFSVYLPAIYRFDQYMNPNEGGYNNTTSKFGYVATVNKKGTWRVLITPKDDPTEHLKNRFSPYVKVILTITPDGYATLAFNDGIYFSGHIEEQTSDSLASN